MLGLSAGVVAACSLALRATGGNSSDQQNLALTPLKSDPSVSIPRSTASCNGWKAGSGCQGSRASRTLVGRAHLHAGVKLEDSLSSPHVCDQPGAPCTRYPLHECHKAAPVPLLCRFQFLGAHTHNLNEADHSEGGVDRAELGVLHHEHVLDP
uniref:Putative secreted protein n=1 Tax=Ixodes ricinus TaxID=34613 RepID=A0A6B0UVT9_IXORI